MGHYPFPFTKIKIFLYKSEGWASTSLFAVPVHQVFSIRPMACGKPCGLELDGGLAVRFAAPVPAAADFLFGSFSFGGDLNVD